MADNEKDKQPEAEGATKKPRNRRLLRSRSDRMLWGVAGGLGEYLRIDPTWVRLGFVAAALFGGFGVIAYLVMAVVVPEDDGSGNPREGRRPPTWAIVLLALAVIVALPGPFWGFGWDHGGWHWWGLFGPLWLLFLVAAGFLVVRAMRRGRLFRGRRDAAANSSTEASEAATTEVPGDADEPPRAVRGIALVALAIAAICAAFFVAACAAWATATGHGDIVAGVIIAIGVAIAATAFIVDARRIAPWLLASALILGLPAGATAAADIHFDGGIGEREYRPASATDLPADGYELGVGQLVVDLRDLPWADGQTVSLSSELGIGQMIVSVPPGVCVDADAKGKAGELVIRGEKSDGVDLEVDQSQPVGKAPRLDLNAEIQIGRLIVTDRDPIAIEERDLSDEDRAEELNSEREACSR